MSEELLYIIPIVLLLPLTGCMLVLQVNPYHALVIRGIFGAIAALVYVLFGAADVALTEALVGTMLSITLYAVAVRSSLSLRVGSIDEQLKADSAQELLSAMRNIFRKYHLRLEIVPYTNLLAMQAALRAKEIHCAYVLTEPPGEPLPPDEQTLYEIQTRVSRLYDIMQTEVSPTKARLRYIDPVNPGQSADVSIPEAMEGKS